MVDCRWRDGAAARPRSSDSPPDTICCPWPNATRPPLRTAHSRRRGWNCAPAIRGPRVAAPAARVQNCSAPNLSNLRSPRGGKTAWTFWQLRALPRPQRTIVDRTPDRRQQSLAPREQNRRECNVRAPRSRRSSGMRTWQILHGGPLNRDGGHPRQREPVARMIVYSTLLQSENVAAWPMRTPEASVTFQTVARLITKRRPVLETRMPE